MILYIHIPFCTSKCGYCAFNSSTDFFHLQADYVEALILDLKHQLHSQELSSIYFGGGTPNALHQKYYEKIFDVIKMHAKLSKDCEITLECNPNLISQSWCEALFALGANRISLGVQSFFEDKLNFLQREHTSYEIARAIDLIYQSGIANMSIDLIYNTPLDSKASLKQEIQQVQALDIAHLSAYALSLDKGSHFFKNPPKLNQKDYSFILRDLLGEIGFKQYEVSSYYAHHKSKHNLAYWRGEDYIGCGAGAVGCLDGVRMKGSDAIPLYIQNPLKKKKEFLTPDERKFEKLFLGLRCEIGIPMQEVDRNKALILIQEGKCKRIENQLIASDFFLADEIALWLS